MFEREERSVCKLVTFVLIGCYQRNLLSLLDERMFSLAHLPPCPWYCSCFSCWLRVELLASIVFGISTALVSVRLYDFRYSASSASTTFYEEVCPFLSWRRVQKDIIIVSRIIQIRLKVSFWSVCRGWLARLTWSACREPVTCSRVKSLKLLFWYGLTALYGLARPTHAKL